MARLTSALTRPGASIRYFERRGEGPAVVFLHGAGADHKTFDAQADAIVDSGGQAILVDLRQHGLSRPNSSRLSAELLVDDVDALVTHLKLHRPVLAGHSLGGNIAQSLVRRNPERFAGLIVVGSTWNAGPLGRRERLLLHLAAPALALIPRRRLYPMMANASAITLAAREDLLRAFSQLSKREFMEVWRAAVQFVVPEPGYRTPVPLLLVRGANDETGNIATAMSAWARAEGVFEHVIPNAGHLVTQDARQAVTGVILDYLENLRTNRAA